MDKTVTLSVEDWIEVLHALAWVNQEYDMVPDQKRIRENLQRQLGLLDKEVWGA